LSPLSHLPFLPFGLRVMGHQINAHWTIGVPQ
jgi:hypothetical protein